MKIWLLVYSLMPLQMESLIRRLFKTIQLGIYNKTKNQRTEKEV